MTEILSTERSKLILHDLDSDIVELIKQCVDEVDDELDHHPEIIIFGKVTSTKKHWFLF